MSTTTNRTGHVATVAPELAPHVVEVRDANGKTLVYGRLPSREMAEEVALEALARFEAEAETDVPAEFTPPVRP